MNKEQIKQEIVYRTARSGGKGGQNVNKVETKVEARLSIPASGGLTDEEKTMLLEKLAAKLTLEAELVVNNQTARSQLENKRLATEKLLKILEKGLVKPVKRKRTTMSAAAKAARLDIKKRHSEKKTSRKSVTVGKGDTEE